MEPLEKEQINNNHDSAEQIKNADPVLDTVDRESTFELDDSLFLSRSILRRLAKKYNKQQGREVLEDELIELIKQDLVTKRQNSLLIKEYFKSKFWRELSLLILASFTVTIVFDYFVTTTGATGIFPAGLGAIARFLSTVTFSDSPSLISSFFFIFYFALNIPLMIFGIFKLGWKFTITTVLYMGFQIAIDQIIQLIPVINPTDFHFIVNFQFISSLDSSWNFAIWLFVFGFVGGAIMGWGYAVVYRIGGSTGGTDFITIWLSKKNSKPVGSINRDVNFIILAIVITANTITLATSKLNPDILIREIEKLNWDTTILKGGHGTINDLIKLSGIGGENLNHIQILQALLQQKPTLFATLADNLPLKIEALIKLQFMVGPSLFGSIVLIVVSGMTTNLFYPKYKLRTFMLATNKPKEVTKKILEAGFQNEIVSWDTTNRSRGNYLHRTMIMLSMPVMQWRELQQELFLVDPYLKITIIRTKAVKGLFKYEPVQNTDRSEFFEKVVNNENEIEKIKQIAIVKFKAQMNNVNERRLKLQKDINAGGERQKRAERELKNMQKRRDEMLVKFKKTMKDIRHMDENNNEVKILNPDKKPSETK